MERNFKKMWIYICLLFVAVVLLILVTSFSNRALDPSYEVHNEQSMYQVNFNKTMQDSIATLTEVNKRLTEQIKSLEKEVEQKDKIIAEYEKNSNLN